MAARGILDSVGFEKGRVGSGEKEVGYHIRESSLRGLLGSVMVILMVMAAMVIFMVYDIRLERKSSHRDKRVQEHHAASKLARVQMELWAQYRGDVQESREASRLMAALQNSYTDFKPQLQAAVADVAKETGLNPDKAADFADRILHVVADLQNDNVAHAKKLVDHLVKEGTKGGKLERRAEEHLLSQVTEEVDHIGEDRRAGIAQEVEDASVGAGGAGAMEPAGADELDPLRAVLQGFWSAFEDYEVAFGGKIRQSFQNGSPLYKELAGLQHKIATWKVFPPTEQDVVRKLDSLGLPREGLRGGLLTAKEVVEELVMVPVVPSAELAGLQVKWKAGKMGSVPVLRRLLELRNKSMLPSSWLQQGIGHAAEQKVERERLDAASAAPPRSAAEPAAAAATPGPAPEP
ncbi:unnamed protein product, partial [Prorocentrum cordatum]